MLASDPGLIRFQKAGRATLSLMASVFTTLLIMQLAGAGSAAALTPSIVSGMAGMLGIMIVMDDTKKGKMLTTGLLGLSAMAGVSMGSLLGGSTVFVDIAMVLLIFSSFYLTRFGVRYFSLCMIAFMTLYFSSILKLSGSQLPPFTSASGLGSRMLSCSISSFFRTLRKT